MHEEAGIAVYRTLITFCGDSSICIDKMLESGAVGIEVDEFMDIDLARQKCQGRATVIRNIDPVEPLLQGTPEQRKSKCGKCLETSADSDRFILSTGCAIAAEDFTG